MAVASNQQSTSNGLQADYAVTTIHKEMVFIRRRKAKKLLQSLSMRVWPNLEDQHPEKVIGGAGRY